MAETFGRGGISADKNRSGSGPDWSGKYHSRLHHQSVADCSRGQTAFSSFPADLSLDDVNIFIIFLAAAACCPNSSSKRLRSIVTSSLVEMRRSVVAMKRVQVRSLSLWPANMPLFCSKPLTTPTDSQWVDRPPSQTHRPQPTIYLPIYPAILFSCHPITVC